ncbi:MAG: hypothetical protein IJA12_08575 [Oscillospiraceae bacterium]|nr:hypothetical protein [Oscillospiraceae bacterium]
MLNHKRYMNIENFRTDLALKFNEGDQIIIQEKLDGSNVSFQYDSEEDKVICFSRNMILSEENTLRGYYDWIQKLDKNKVRDILGTNLRMFGEWLVKHALDYPKECYETVYCFDVFDTEKEVYLPQSEVRVLAEKLGLRYVPVFFEGRFTKWDDYLPLVGKTDMGGEIGEGIVVKNMSSLDHNVIYTKIVHERFREVHRAPKPKPTDMELIRERERLTELAGTIVTEARVKKLLYKLIDDGIVPENYTIKDTSLVMKNLPSAVYYDCLKEEPEVVSQFEQFGKYSGPITIRIFKKMVADKEKQK